MYSIWEKENFYFQNFYQNKEQVFTSSIFVLVIYTKNDGTNEWLYLLAIDPSLSLWQTIKKQIEVINILILIAKKYLKKIGRMRKLILFKMW